MSARRLDASGLRSWALAAVDGLVAHADEINRLNVFPVADSDTGTNMLFTMRSACATADPEILAADPDDLAAVAAALADGALHGARGNSGVILSQIMRALADVTTGAADDTLDQLAVIDPPVLAAALRHAVGRVATSMGELVPGTIVSVLQAAAEASERAAEQGEIADAAIAAADAAAVALDKTPEQLDVLARAGVVDAGGRGLLVLLDALVGTLTGHAPHRAEYRPSPHAEHTETSDAAPNYEVMYLLRGCIPDDVDELRKKLESLGDSVAIAAGGGDTHSVHVHADDAGAAVEAGMQFGAVSGIQIAAMTAGAAPGRWTRERAVLAVVDGEGAAELFGSEGAHVLQADQGTAVSAQQMLRAVVDTGAGQIMVLPNGFVAAEELVAGATAASGWGIDVVPVPTGSMVQGLAALAVHDPDRAAVDDGYAMARAAGATRRASVRVAAERALTFAGPCEPGDGLGVAGDEVLVVRRDLAATARRLLDLLLAGGGEMVTVLIGDGVSPKVAPSLEAHMHRHHLGTELLTYVTGHRGDALLIGVE